MQRLMNQSEDVFVEYPVCVISVAIIMNVVFWTGAIGSGLGLMMFHKMSPRKHHNYW